MICICHHLRLKSNAPVQNWILFIPIISPFPHGIPIDSSINTSPCNQDPPRSTKIHQGTHAAVHGLLLLPLAAAQLRQLRQQTQQVRPHPHRARLRQRQAQLRRRVRAGRADDAQPRQISSTGRHWSLKHDV